MSHLRFSRGFGDWGPKSIKNNVAKNCVGCVKIYKKPRDTDSRGKYIPKHKRGPDVELFKGENLFFLKSLS